MSWLVITLVIALFILLTALYVAAEFSTISARRARLTQLAADGNSLARQLLPYVRDPQQLDTYIAACQVGITLAGLLLGFYGQAQLAPVAAPWLAGLLDLTPAAAEPLAASLVLVLLTVLTVVLGELVPKSIGIQYPERLALLTTPPMRWSIILFRPLIWLFNGSGRLLLRLLGVPTAAAHLHLHQPQEILLLFEESSAGGLIDLEESRLLKNSLELREMPVRQVMIPRNRLLAASLGQSCASLLALLADSQYSRLPLYQDSVDNIVGLVHLKDLLCLKQLPGQHSASEVLRPVLFVPETMPVDRVFAQMQRQRHHVTVVLDEYGGTAGLVTLEDLIEEIFGDLQDEFDPESPPQLRLMGENQVLIRGDMLLDDLNEALDLMLPSDEVDTIGGLVLNACEHVPAVGEAIPIANLQFVIEGLNGNAISTVSLAVSPEQIVRFKEWLA